MRPLLKPDDVERVTGRPITELARMIPHIRIGARTLRFKPEDVEAFVELGPAGVKIRRLARELNIAEGGDGHVYFVEAANTDLLKIGFAVDVARRIQTLQCASPHDLYLVAAIPGSRAMEARFHRHFEPVRARGEWFRFGGELATFVRYFENNRSAHNADRTARAQ